MRICNRIGGTGGGSLLLILALVFISPLETRAQTDEYGLKAEFLSRFAQFTSWNNSAFSTPNSALEIGILGKDPFGKKLKDACKGKHSTDGRSLVVRQSRSAKDLAKCQIVFITKGEKGRAKAAIAALGKNTLIVGDWEECAKIGGAVGMSLRRGKIRFVFNPAAAKRLGVTLSSKLLRLGKIVR